MFVCLCHGITDKQIERTVREQGVGNIRELKQALSFGNSCGTCINMAQQLIDSTIVDDSLYKNVG